ncbi:flagellar hook protein FlgE [Caldanaerobius polysaccharolyticus]|uniref:flagellar hook protein FlgE n=1 Tax=Caldanaerobius polysaccharolyticus TaxID=44256 RepID=UPI00047AC521|nr:flagellar hook protein FlgE [Caldanaerobius polysaccharolyticus]
MMRSMYSAVSGLKAEQAAMDVIGNNVANVNTVGFKASRVTFKDVMSQLIKGASMPQDNMGGTNPQQIGLGVAIGSIDTLFSQGSSQRTDNPLDVMIDGNGFFTVGDLTGSKSYTRAGNFGVDSQGNLVTAGGLYVYGWRADSTGKVDTSGDLVPLNLYAQLSKGASATQNVKIGGNLNANLAVDDFMTYDEMIYDSLGRSHIINLKFTKTGVNAWDISVSSADSALTNITINTSSIAFDSNGKLTSPAADSNGRRIIQLSITDSDGANSPQTINLDITDLTQYAGVGMEKDTVKEVSKDGNPAGSMESFEIDQYGNVNVTYSNGQNVIIGQLAIANIPNPMGLEKAGDNLYKVTPNSGDPDYGTAGTGGRGVLNPGSLEMSNVDLAQEFTNMIVTQRGYQANARVITASDAMLQDLVNIVR